MTTTPVIILPTHSNSTVTVSSTSSSPLIDSLHNSQATEQHAPSTSILPVQASHLTKYHPTLSVGEWVNGNRKERLPFLPMNQDWKDVHRNIKQMDQLYDATFYSWLKSEDNVLVTSMYLHRIANEYSMDRIINAVKWLVADWRWESTSILVRHITVDWCNEEGDMRRAQLLRHLTQTWATQYTATLITTILATPPYVSAPDNQRERFIRSFTDDWDFSKLSEFFMYLSSQANIDYKIKCIMLQEAARRERESLSAKLNRRRRRRYHHENALTTTFGTTSSSSAPSSTVTTETTDSTYSSISMDHQISADTISLHRNRLHYDEHTLGRTSSTSQVCALPQPQQSSPSPSPQQSSRYHHAHRRISSNDIKRQRYSSAFEEESTDMDYETDEQQYILTSSGSSTHLKSSSDQGSGESTENGNLTNDLSRLDLGSAIHGNSSVSSGTPSSSSSSSSSSSFWTRRRSSNSSNGDEDMDPLKKINTLTSRTIQSPFQ